MTRKNIKQLDLLNISVYLEPNANKSHSSFELYSIPFSFDEHPFEHIHSFNGKIYTKMTNITFFLS